MADQERKNRVDEEYSILRDEILQYMEEYQTLRNMMYVGTVGLLGVNMVKEFSMYLYLLPLVIILPSYILFYDYWKSVSYASIYMQVFLEGATEEGGSLHMWETRHARLSRELEGTRWYDLRKSGMFCHHIPYFLCAFLCFVLYGMEFFTAGLQPTSAVLAAVLGIVLVALSLVVFAHFHKPDLVEIRDKWEEIKRDEAAAEAEEKAAVE